MKLPKGCKIVPGPNPKFRFVQLPNGLLVPNQGTRPTDREATDAEIISDFFIYWKRMNP